VLTYVATGGELSAGFAIVGDTPKTVLIRAVGPSLAAFGVTDRLPDPKLALFRGTTPIAANDDWYLNEVVGRYVREATATVGAFPLPMSVTYPITTSKDAAIVVTLPPGAYTVVVGDATGTAGKTLVEIYEVP
jgi:hypothetical protein